MNAFAIGDWLSKEDKLNNKQKNQTTLKRISCNYNKHSPFPNYHNSQSIPKLELIPIISNSSIAQQQQERINFFSFL